MKQRFGIIAAFGLLAACEVTDTSGVNVCWVGDSNRTFGRDGPVVTLGGAKYWPVAKGSFEAHISAAEGAWLRSAEKWEDTVLKRKLETAVANDASFARFDEAANRLMVMIPLRRSNTGTMEDDDPDYLVLTSWLDRSRRWKHDHVWCRNAAALRPLKP